MVSNMMRGVWLTGGSDQGMISGWAREVEGYIRTGMRQPRCCLCSGLEVEQKSVEVV